MSGWMEVWIKFNNHNLSFWSWGLNNQLLILTINYFWSRCQQVKILSIFHRAYFKIGRHEKYFVSYLKHYALRKAFPGKRKRCFSAPGLVIFHFLPFYNNLIILSEKRAGHWVAISEEHQPILWKWHHSTVCRWKIAFQKAFSGI